MEPNEPPPLHHRRVLLAEDCPDIQRLVRLWLERAGAILDIVDDGADAARLAIDPDEPAERAYLDALAAQLRLPAELRATLDAMQKTPA